MGPEDSLQEPGAREPQPTASEEMGTSVLQLQRTELCQHPKSWKWVPPPSSSVRT